MRSLLTLQKIQSAIQSFLTQGFVDSCCLCSRSANRVFCEDCWRQVLACQQFAPLPSSANDPPMMVWGRYQGALKRAIAQMKYQNQPHIASVLGEELGLRWLQKFPTVRSFQIIPIPLHRARLAQRGYNQAELIAKRFSQVLGVPCWKQGLIRIRETQAQHLLDPGERQHNLLGAFAVNHNFKQKSRPQSILLVDDIFTTGTTIAEAKNALERNQFKVLGTVVVAQASLR